MTKNIYEVIIGGYICPVAQILRLTLPTQIPGTNGLEYTIRGIFVYSISHK